jgi:hypothetical protein
MLCVPGLLPAAIEIPANLVVMMMALGVVVAIAGHLAGSRGVVALGILVLFAATMGMMIGGFFAFQDDPRDPRPCTTVFC